MSYTLYMHNHLKTSKITTKSSYFNPMVVEKAVVILRQNYKMFVYFSVYDFVALVCENFKYGYKIFKPAQQCL